jgi:hypothetical protein
LGVSSIVVASALHASETGDMLMRRTCSRLIEHPPLAADIQNLKAAIQDITQKMHVALEGHNAQDGDNIQKKIIILGPTRSGKDTLLNYLAGKNLVVRKDERRPPIIDIDSADTPLPGTLIGHAMSETTLPSSWRSTDMEVYWNCPGFRDSRGPAQDVVNTFAIHKLLFGDTKIVLAVAESHIGGDNGVSFVKLLHQMTKMFPGEQLRNCLSLVITKQGRDADIDIPGLLEWLSEQPQSAIELLNQDVRNLLQYLISHISNFPYPTRDGLYPVEPRESILASISSTGFITPNAIPQIEPSSIRFLKDLAKALNDDISQHLRTTVAQRILEHCKNMMKTCIGEIDSLRRNIADLRILLKEHHDMFSIKREFSSEEMENFANNLDLFFDSNNPNIIRTTLKNLFFLKEIKNDITFNNCEWSSALLPTINQLKELIKYSSYEMSDNTLNIKGNLLGAKDINTLLTNRKETDIRLLNIFASSAFLIDEDIKTDGISINIFSPIWNIIGNRIINLSGKSGEGHELIEKPGQNGLPGNPGKNGGHFYGKGEVYQNLDKLTVNTSGGKGGAGQNGGAGGAGIDGEDGTRQSVMDRIADTMVRSRYTLKDGDGKFKEATLRSFIDDTQIYKISLHGTQCTYTSEGKAGTPGQNGGKGGKGGKGGYQGFCKLEGPSGPLEPLYRLINNRGEEGAAGKAGEGGIGGKNGISYSSDYIITPICTYYHYFTPGEYYGWGIPTIGIGALVLKAIENVSRQQEWPTILRTDIENTNELATREHREMPERASNGETPSHDDLNPSPPKVPTPLKTLAEVANDWEKFYEERDGVIGADNNSTEQSTLALVSSQERDNNLEESPDTFEIREGQPLEDETLIEQPYSSLSLERGTNSNLEEEREEVIGADNNSTEQSTLALVSSQEGDDNLEESPDTFEIREEQPLDGETLRVGDLMIKLYNNDISNVNSPEAIYNSLRESPEIQDIPDNRLIIVINSILGANF